MLWVIGFGLFFSSCQNEPISSNDPIQLIPSNVEMVFAISPQQLLDKGGFDDLQKRDFYKEMIEDINADDPMVAAILKDPAEAGIDLNEHIYISADYDDSMTEDSISAMLYMSIADPDKFEAALNAIELKIQPASQDLNFVHAKRGPVLGWNDQFAIIGLADFEEVTPEMVQEMLLVSEETLADQKNIKKWLANDFDLSHWLRGTAVSGALKAGMLGDLVVGREQLENSFIHSFLTFENGEIMAKSDFYLDRQIKADLDLLFKNKVKTDFAAIFPSENLMAMMTAGLSIKGANQLLIEKYSKGLADEGLDQFGLTVEELSNAIDGDVAIGAYDDADEEQLLVGLKVADQEAFQGILEKMLKAELITKTSDNRYEVSQDFNVEVDQEKDSVTIEGNMKVETIGHFIVQDDLIFVSNRTDLLDLIEKGDYATSGDVLDRMAVLSKDNIFSTVLPFEMMFGFNKDKFEDFPGEWMEIRADRHTIELNVEFKDKSQNALKQMFDYAENERAKKDGTQKKI